MHHLYFNPRQGVVSVKQGFSWPAFLFGSLWAMVHHMWVPYVLLLLPIEWVFWLLIGYAQSHGNGPMLLVASLGNLVFAIVRGRRGNQWRATALERRGYAESDNILRLE